MKLNKILAVAFLVANALTSTSFSMDHPDMKLAKNTTDARRIGNEALHERDSLVIPSKTLKVALEVAGADAVTGLQKPLQPLLNQCATAAKEAIKIYVETTCNAVGDVVVNGAIHSGALIGAASNMFGPNAGRTGIASPNGQSMAILLNALYAVVDDYNTQVEMFVHDGAILDIPSKKLSVIHNTVSHIHRVMGQKIHAYVMALRPGANSAVLRNLKAGGATMMRDAFAAALRDVVLAAF
jgi:hypothetical protein